MSIIILPYDLNTQGLSHASPVDLGWAALCQKANDVRDAIGPAQRKLELTHAWSQKDVNDLEAVESRWDDAKRCLEEYLAEHYRE